MFSFFSHLIGSAGDSVFLLSLVVMLSAFLFEDATTIIVGVLAADGVIPVPIALISLCLGTIAGDTVLYSIGLLARTHPRLARYVDHEFTARFRSWLENRYNTIILSGHFVPGLRSMTYLASGFFRFPFSRFIPIAVVSGLLLESVLFALAYGFGSVSSAWLKEVRWGVAAVFIIGLFLTARHNMLSYRKKESGSGSPGTDADTPAQ